MKELRETKLIEQTTVTFIAEDGTTFEDETSCKNYELQQDKKKCKELFEDNVFESYLNIPFCDYGSPCTLILVELKNKSDFHIMQNYVNSLSSYMDFDCEEPKLYPVKQVLVIGDEWAVLDGKTIEMLKKELLEVCNSL